MKNTRLLLICAAATLALGACKSMSYDAVTTSAAGGGAQINASGLTIGYVQTDMAQTPVVDQSGKAITVTDACGAANPLSTYSILSGNATASTNTTSGQSASVAVNRGQATGEAATRLAGAAEISAHGGNYDPEASTRDCSRTAAVLAAKPAP